MLIFFFNIYSMYIHFRYHYSEFNEIPILEWNSWNFCWKLLSNFFLSFLIRILPYIRNNFLFLSRCLHLQLYIFTLNLWLFNSGTTKLKVNSKPVTRIMIHVKNFTTKLFLIFVPLSLSPLRKITCPLKTFFLFDKNDDLKRGGKTGKLKKFISRKMWRTRKIRIFCLLFTANIIFSVWIYTFQFLTNYFFDFNFQGFSII